MSTSLEPQTKTFMVLPSPRDPAPSDQVFTPRENFSTRAFPPGCGRNIQLISTHKYLRFVSSGKSCSTDFERRILERGPSEKRVRNEVKHATENHNFMPVGSSVSPLNEKKHKIENLGRLTTKIKAPPKGKVAYLDPAQLAIRRNDENVISGCKKVVSHDRAIEALKMFRNLLMKEKEKLKERGNLSNRIDLLAYESLKKTNLWFSLDISILGSVPGVEVGDRFQYRVELSVVGLHRPLESGIDYLKKDGKIIATSIVASGVYDNDMYGDVLFYSGQGGKPTKGDKLPKHQMLKRGNLALKNSLKEKNVVRVIFGSKELRDSDSTNARGMPVRYFVYGGLYLVENYWLETGDFGSTNFKFQLRRLPGQSKLPLTKNQKNHGLH